MPKAAGQLCHAVLRMAALCAVLAAVGCGTTKPKPAEERYPRLPLKQVPSYLTDTIYQRADVIDTDALHVSGFGLVARLEGTGDNSLVPTAVRSYMVKEMVKQGFGSKLK